MKRNSRLYLIRHGQVKGYENFPVNGHTDVELTQTGVLQMQQMAERLRLIEPGAIYSSDLERSVTGARFVARYHDVPLYLLPELREIYFGTWEGLPLAEIRDRFPGELEKRQADLMNYETPGGGESLGRFLDRITKCLERILDERKGDDLVIVAHGGVNRVVLCQALGLDLNRMFNIHQDYGCLNTLDYYPDFTLVRLING